MSFIGGRHHNVITIAVLDLTYSVVIVKEEGFCVKSEEYLTRHFECGIFDMGSWAVPSALDGRVDGFEY